MFRTNMLMHDARLKELTEKNKELLTRLENKFNNETTSADALNEAGETLQTAIKSQGYSMYLVKKDEQLICLHPKYIKDNPRFVVKYKIEVGTTLAAYVAHTEKPILVDDVLGDLRFPEGIPGTSSMVKSALCVPVITSDGACIAVFEYYRFLEDTSFTESELRIAINLVNWMGFAIRETTNRLHSKKRDELITYLQNSVAMFFSNLIFLDTLLTNFLTFLRASVGAEKCVIYKIENAGKTGASCFIYEENIDTEDQVARLCTKKKKSLASHSQYLERLVVQTGDCINIKDAYSDTRFSKDLDEGEFLTTSILAMPVKNKNGRVMGPTS